MCNDLCALEDKMNVHRFCIPTANSGLVLLLDYHGNMLMTELHWTVITDVKNTTHRYVVIKVLLEVCFFLSFFKIWQMVNMSNRKLGDQLSVKFCCFLVS